MVVRWLLKDGKKCYNRVMNKFILNESLLNEILNVLSKRPYVEVQEIINKMLKEITLIKSEVAPEIKEKTNEESSKESSQEGSKEI